MVVAPLGTSWGVGGLNTCTLWERSSAQESTNWVKAPRPNRVWFLVSHWTGKAE